MLSMHTGMASALLALLLALPAGLAAAEGEAAPAVKLPAPKKAGGPSVLEAIDQRTSGSYKPEDYQGALSDETLSTLFWAASGHNRDGKKWTVPMAKGTPPYVKIYLVTEKAVAYYDWSEHAMVPVAMNEDRRALLGMQPFTKTASALMIFVADDAALAAFPPAARDGFANVLVGAMTQNVYLAARALDVNARYAASVFRTPEAKKALGLDEHANIVCLMALGHALAEKEAE